MTMLEAHLRVPDVVTTSAHCDEAELAVGAFLARYSGRTFEAYGFDLRTFFQWAEDAGLAVLQAKRAHIELYRSNLEERGLAPRPSIDDFRRSAASIASRTSTDMSPPILPSTSDDLGSFRPNGEAGPIRARDIPLRVRALRPRPHRLGCAPRPQRTPGQ
jgi:hypothetical protein